MNWLQSLLTPALVRALGWTLVHSLWQGAVVALALGGLLLLLRRHSAAVRYRVAGCALVTLLLLAAVTFGRYYAAAGPVASASDSQVTQPVAAAAPAVAAPLAALAPAAATPAALGRLAEWASYFDHNLPLLVTAWLLGLLAMTLRLLGGLAYVQRLRRYRVQPLSPEWQQRLGNLAARAGLTRPVALLESALVQVPLVVGHLRPVILLPLGTATGLSPVYLEAILAHELAHVARRDYLLNLVQSVAEILFFYHPGVWFITATLRAERENCCDDAATALVGGNPLTLARALTALAERNLAAETTPRLALAAVGGRGSLLGRIRRLVQGRTAPTFTEGFMAACVVVSGLVLLTTAVALADPRPAASPNSPLKHWLRRQLLPDTTKATTADTLRTVLAPKVPAVMEAPAPPPSNRRRRARAATTVVVPAPPRTGNSVVVVEKDKKGRLQKLYVDGQLVNTGTKAKGREKKARSVGEESAQMRTGFGPASAQSFAWPSGPGQSFTLVVPEKPGLSLRQEARRQEQRGRQQRQFRIVSPPAQPFAFNWEGEGMLSDQRLISQQALQAASRSLAQAEREATSEEARQRIAEARARLLERQAEQAERAAEQDERAAEQHRQHLEYRTERSIDNLSSTEEREIEADMRRLETQLELLAQRMEHLAGTNHDQEEHRRVEIRTRVSKDGRPQNDKAETAMTQALLRDRLIRSADNFQLTLNSQALTIDGKRQTAALRDKYLRLLREATGRSLTGTNNYALTRRTNRGGDVAPPMPPRPARAPQAAPPQPPRPPQVSLPPAPPAPPRIDSEMLRRELRKDGLIGASQKAFQFQLNETGLTVDGKVQPAETARRYRQLLEWPEPAAGQKSKRNIQISVDE